MATYIQLVLAYLKLYKNTHETIDADWDKATSYIIWESEPPTQVAYLYFLDFLELKLLYTIL